MSYTEVPTDMLLDLHELVIECRRGLKLDGWKGIVVMTADSKVIRILEPVTKWLEYNAATLLQKPELDPQIRARLLELRYRAEVTSDETADEDSGSDA